MPRPKPIPSPSRQRPLSPQFWSALYACLLAALLALSAQYAIKLLAITPEFAQAGDFFGYFQMAQDIHRGAAPNHGQPFTFDSPHARLLLHHLQSENLPLAGYTELLAPNGYHYQPRGNLFANQYPPGVPMLLALFPQKDALHIADAITLALLLAFPLCIFILTATRWRNRPQPAALACGFSTLAAAVGLFMFGISVSFSIDLFCLPLLLIFLCIHIALPRDNAAGKIAALLAGALFGYALTCRLATALFLPGFLLLLWPLKPQCHRLTKPALFLLATILCGILPLLIHQSRLTGSIFIPTYISHDAAVPTLSSIPHNIAFYSLSSANLFLLTLLITAACLYALLLHSAFRIPHSAFTRYLQSIPIFFAIPTIYFLTHAVTTDYYQLPTILVCLFAIAFASLAFLTQPQSQKPSANAQLTPIITGILAALLAWHVLTLPPLPTTAQMQPPSTELPAPLKNPNAWIFGDRFTGTLWYYHAIPSAAILHSSPDARLQTYRFIFHRHEPLLLLYDNPALDPIVHELQHLGATLTPIATFGNRPILQIHWPPTGPLNAASFATAR